MAEIRQSYFVHETTRERVNNWSGFYELLSSRTGGRRFILLDIGGYFAKILHNIAAAYPAQLAGVVEDTENGHQKYAAMEPLTVPAVSVARSFSKRNEDWLVGQSIVFSSECLLRTMGTTLTAKNPLVIGFGKIGQSIAHSLRSHGLAVTVWDFDPSQRVLANCHNFFTLPKYEALRKADLVFCATGNKSLRAEDFRTLKSGSFVISVTSADDEFDFAGLERYNPNDICEGVTLLQTQGHEFYLANHGNAVNFLHGAESRPYVHLVQAAILHGVDMLLKGEAQAGKIMAISQQRETLIAYEFERFFCQDVFCSSDPRYKDLSRIMSAEIPTSKSSAPRKPDHSFPERRTTRYNSQRTRNGS